MSIELEEKVRSSLEDGRLPCPIAFKIARELEVNLREIGDAANKFGIRINNCQLGFFGARKTMRENIDDIEIKNTVVETIESSLVDGRLPCPVALELAKKVKVGPQEIGDTATKLRIGITDCGLGLFQKKRR